MTELHDCRFTSAVAQLSTISELDLGRQLNPPNRLSGHGGASSDSALQELFDRSRSWLGGYLDGVTLNPGEHRPKDDAVKRRDGVPIEQSG